ncbi:OmpA family protein [Algoriphagus sp. CAU 1675]|uniref:OmpA family protein n=1 Tax=Algoriphagus sp. CAU 1675 TaxID=3032597 RepID=UPI0023DC28F1|nr:OmpA family protein [Algoriphagus sp. CAU 1675]MDF2157757.1 OmpA family protein [Algoriphagus sp. CAU 1675]
MTNSLSFISKASRITLLAFCFSAGAIGQEIKSLSEANSSQDDRNPVWVGGNSLLFTRAFHPLNKGGVNDPGDIWMSRKTPDGNWSEAIHIAELSSSGYDLVLGMQDALTLLVYQKNQNGQGIYQYSKFGADWNFLSKVDFPGLDQLQGTITGGLSSDGKILFLSGIGEDSRGNEDIYLSVNEEELGWSTPKNLGSLINTIGQETSPYFDGEKMLFFFCSNMHEGAEGKDVFVSKALDQDLTAWSKPIKWEKISSPGSEGSVTFIGQNEIVWSSTQNSDGFADLLTFSIPVPLEIPTEFEETEIQGVPEKEKENKSIIPIYPSTSIGFPEIMVQVEKAEVPLSVVVLDQKTKERIPFRLQSLNLQKEYSQDSLFLSKLREDGVVELVVKSGGYFPQAIKVDQFKAGEPLVVLLIKAEAGNSFLLEKVEFKRGTAVLEGLDSEAFLDKLVQFLIENPDVKIRINGHTDSAGDPSLNKALSLERAASVRDYLIQQGVDFERLRISGWGGTRPIASNSTEVGREKNRRVEITVEQ